MSRQDRAAALRSLPQVQRLLERPDVAALARTASRPAVTAALRAVLDEARAELLRDGAAGAPSAAELVARTGDRLAARGPVLRRVINATGVALHTNLGRAPLAAEAIEAVADAARGYLTLEYDPETGGRGPRAPGVEAALRALTGAEAAVAVNNGAAAILLALAALAGGGEVIVSRGELVEIGGGFRIPDVIRQGGAKLVEVGTTNKTRLADYRDAITSDTRVLLKVHQSNYRVVGFTAEATVAELAPLARERGLSLVLDLGSGTLADLRGLGRPHEPTVGEAVGAGADLVTFSGDKLLGGPQAGILAGRAAAVDPVRRHPLLRALRLDKLSLAALEATLHLHAAGDAGRIPTLRMLGQTEAVLDARAARLCALLAGVADTAVVPTAAEAGGGSLPGTALPSRAVAVHLPGLPTEELARRLRRHRPAVVGRLQEGKLLLDLFAVADAELPEVAAAVASAERGAA